MKTALLLSALAALPARALPAALDVDRLTSALGAEGFDPPTDGLPFDFNFPIPEAVAPDPEPPAGTRVALAGLLDAHLAATDWFDDAAGRTSVAGTLDLEGGAWLAVTPPGSAPLYVKIEGGMSARWSAGGRNYSLDLDVSIFRARLNNNFEIRDSTSGSVLWRRRISDLFRRTYDAGLPVAIAGRRYRLFYARMPDPSSHPAAASEKRGICLIYDQLDGAGRHDQYDFYRFSLESLSGGPAPVRLYGGEQAFLQVSSDGAEVAILP